jgi:hypothetical protein
MPARIAKLEGVLETGRQEIHKSGEPVRVRPPSRRQLEQHRAQTIAEEQALIQESPQGLTTVLELLAVGDVAAGLEGETKPGRHGVEPIPDGLDRGKPVEAAVDLDTGEPPRIVRKPEPLRQVLRIKWAPPMVVLPSARTQVQAQAGISPIWNFQSSHLVSP